MIIGISGPVGSGKNEACKILKRCGANVIEADQIGHELLQKNWAQIVKIFGSKVLQRGGRVDRKKLGRIVFSDKAALKKLNGLMHPLIKERIKKIIEENRDSPVQIINAALIKEISLIELCDQVWVVVASKEKRIKRMLKKLGAKASSRINGIMKSQMTKAGYLEIADKVFENNSSIKELRGKVKEYISELFKGGEKDRE